MKQKISWIVTAAIWIIVWQLTYMAVGKEFIVPSFLRTVESLGEMLQTTLFYQSVLATMTRVVLGMTGSFFCGILCAMAGYRYWILRQQIDGLVAVIKSTPVLAVVLYLILWMPSTHVPTFVCFLMCYPVVYTNIITGLDSMNREYVEMADVYRIGAWDRVRFLYVPSVKPQVKAALSLIAGLSWKTVVAGEVLSIPRYSMGYHLMESKIYFETAQLFAWMIAIIVLSICFEKLVKVVLAWI